MPHQTPSGQSPEGTPPPPDHGPPPAGQRWFWAVLGIVILLVVVVVVAIQRHSRSSQSASSRGPAGPVPVSTVLAQQGDMGVSIDALGSVTPVNTVMVKSRVDGELMSVDYRQGELVREGDILVEIDPRPFEAQLLQAQGQYERDKALLENALIDLKRYQTAFAKNAVPEQTLATQQATAHQAQGNVKLDQALVDTARLQLIYCRITAPISGRVGLRLVDPGNIVHASDSNPIVVITQIQPITVIFSVAEDYLPQIQEQLSQGQRLLVQTLDRSQQHKLGEGYVDALDNLVDPSTGTLKLRALFQNEQGTLFPNQFVNVSLRISTLHDVTLVPSVAIQRNSQGAFVYLVSSNSTVSVQQVQTLASERQETAVKGLTAGMAIASDNFNRLQQGTRVSVHKEPGSTVAAKPNALTQTSR